MFKFLFPIALWIRLLVLCSSVKNHVFAAHLYNSSSESSIIQCLLKQIMIFPSPGSKHSSSAYVCEREGIHDDRDSLEIELVGDISTFVRKNQLSTDDILIFSKSLLASNKLNVNAIAASQITVKKSSRLSPLNVSIVGKKRLLIVRCSKDYSQNNALKVGLSKNELFASFFRDQNGVRHVFKRCSWNKLKIQPAEGRGYVGVITMDIPDNFCSFTHKEAKKYIQKILEDDGFEFDYAHLVFPDCIDFESALAYGQKGGRFAWFHAESVFSSQVHEMGHNLGLGHSGSWGVEVLDYSCQMGKSSGRICFNAAKTWDLGWHSKYQISVDPSISAFKGKLVGIADRNYVSSGEYIVLRLQGTSDSVFLMYNRGKGINKDAFLYPNSVLVTRQLSAGGNSQFLDATLAKGESKVIVDDWNFQNQSLIIHQCRNEKVDTVTWDGKADKKTVVHIIAYVEGKTTASCN